MAKRIKYGVDIRSANPSKTKRMGRSQGPMVFNEHVGRMVTPKLDKAINNNNKKK